MPPAVSLDSLRKTYGSTVAVDDLSLEVERGEIFGLIGPNGAGKTTTVECILGLREPDSGRVRVLGKNPHGQRSDLQHRIGAQLQNAALPHRITVQEAVDLFSSFYPRTLDTDRLLAEWGLDEKRTTAFDDLSGGQKQRLFVTLALLHDPEVVVLDEISTGLDPEARQQTRDLIRSVRNAGTTVLLVTHFMDEAEALCDRVAMMNQGRCVALDTPSALISRLDAPYRVQFSAPTGFDPGPLETADGVHALATSNGRIDVRGRGDLLTTVVRHLNTAGLVPDDLRAERASLDDVFLTLTDPPQETETDGFTDRSRPSRQSD